MDMRPSPKEKYASDILKHKKKIKYMKNSYIKYRMFLFEYGGGIAV